MLSIRYEWPKNSREKGKEIFVTGGETYYYFIVTGELQRFDDLNYQLMGKRVKELMREFRKKQKEMQELQKKHHIKPVVYGKPREDIIKFNQTRRDRERKEVPVDWLQYNAGQFEHESMMKEYDSSKDSGRWITRKCKVREYEHPIGTALIQFLNFDFDMHIDGGYKVSWISKDGMNFIRGWEKNAPRFPKDSMWDRKMFTEHMLLYFEREDQCMEEDAERLNPPFVLKMFPKRMYDFVNWEYRQEDIKRIKDLQRMFRHEVDNIFIPADENDKRTAIERFNDEKINPNYGDLTKEIAKKLAEGFHKDGSCLEYILFAEYFAMLYCNTMVIVCENCGMYSIPKKRQPGTRFCSRKYYTDVYTRFRIKDGSWGAGMTKYIFTCQQDGLSKEQHEKEKEDIISYTISLDYERLRKFCCCDEVLIGNSQFRQILHDNYNSLYGAYYDAVSQNEAEFRKRLTEAKTQDEKISLACELTKIIEDAVNTKLKEIFSKKYANKNIEDLFELNYKKRMDSFKKRMDSFKKYF